MECNTAYDSLDRFQTLAKSLGGVSPTELQAALDDEVIQVRKVQGLALVFPKCPPVDALFSATSGMKTERDARGEERLEALLEACEEVRAKALVSPDVL